MYAHGGMFRTAGVAQRFLAAAIDAPVAVAATASEGGAWGIAVLAAYLDNAERVSLTEYLAEAVFVDEVFASVAPDAEDIAGYATYLSRYEAGLAIERAAGGAI